MVLHVCTFQVVNGQSPWFIILLYTRSSQWWQADYPVASPMMFDANIKMWFILMHFWASYTLQPCYSYFSQLQSALTGLCNSSYISWSEPMIAGATCIKKTKSFGECKIHIDIPLFLIINLHYLSLANVWICLVSQSYPVRCYASQIWFLICLIHITDIICIYIM